MNRQRWMIKRVLAPNHIELLSQTKFVLSVLGESVLETQKYPHELIASKAKFSKFCKAHGIKAERVIVTFDTNVPEYTHR